MRVIGRLPLVLLAVLLAADSGRAQGVRFGGAVALDGDMVVVGEAANALRPGTVYVYRRNGAAWEEATTLTAPDAAVRDGFGAPLALGGSTLFVGQRNMVHLFTAAADGKWELGSTITAAAERAGRVLAGTDEWLFVGVPTVRPPGYGYRRGSGQPSPTPGSVDVYRRNADGEWSQHGQLTAPESVGGDGFGAAIAVDDDLALIGAPGSDEQLGSAYVYRLDATSGEWREAGRLQPSDPEEGEDFGAAVAFGSDIAVVGAPGSANGGAAFVFRHDPAEDAWVEDVRLTAFAGDENDRFGTAVAANGGDVWVGAPSDGLGTGSTYVFRAEGAGSSLSTARLVELGEMQPSDRFGDVVALTEGLAAIAATGMDHRAGTVFLYAADDTGEWGEAAVLESEDEALAMHAGEALECADGGKIDLFECGNVELLSFLPVTELTLPGENRGSRTNDVWGWLDPETGREYAIVGRIDGTSFVDVTDPVNPFLVGDLPQTPDGPPSPTWRDIKVYDDHAFIVADAAGAHGMQVFDLTQLRDVRDEPVRFEPTAHYDRINSAHNIVINEETGFAYSVGSSGGGETCGGGLHMIDIREPTNPTFAGCFADAQTGRRGTGYTHDAQCVIYRGPDERYHDREICLGANETAISIADVTEKDNPVAISRASYPNPGYTHQGWLSEDQRYFFVDDELDELQGNAERTRTLIWDLSDLEDPILANEFFGTTAASDHNLYIRGDLMYQSNYRAGLRIIDVSEPLDPREVGYLDTSPYLPPEAGFSGTWSNYPFFESGAVAVASGNEGLFLVRYRSGEPVLDN